MPTSRTTSSTGSSSSTTCHATRPSRSPGSSGLTSSSTARTAAMAATRRRATTRPSPPAPTIVVMLHPDYQYDATRIPALIGPIADGTHDLMLGSRFLGDPLAGGMPRWKYVSNRFLTGLENRAFGLHLSEYHTGLRAYSRGASSRPIPYQLNSDDFVFDQELIAQVVAAGMAGGSARSRSRRATSRRRRRSASGGASSTACRRSGSSPAYVLHRLRLRRSPKLAAPPPTGLRPDANQPRRAPPRDASGSPSACSRSGSSSGRSISRPAFDVLRTAVAGLDRPDAGHLDPRRRGPRRPLARAPRPDRAACRTARARVHVHRLPRQQRPAGAPRRAVSESRPGRRGGHQPDDRPGHGRRRAGRRHRDGRRDRRVGGLRPERPWRDEQRCPARRGVRRAPGHRARTRHRRASAAWREPGRGHHRPPTEAPRACSTAAGGPRSRRAPTRGGRRRPLQRAGMDGVDHDVPRCRPGSGRRADGRAGRPPHERGRARDDRAVGAGLPGHLRADRRRDRVGFGVPRDDAFAMGLLVHLVILAHDFARRGRRAPARQATPAGAPGRKGVRPIGQPDPTTCGRLRDAPTSRTSSNRCTLRHRTLRQPDELRRTYGEHGGGRPARRAPHRLLPRAGAGRRRNDRRGARARSIGRPS